VADEGWTKLQAVWNKSKPEYRNYAVKHQKTEWDALRTKARGVPS
jgi:hypothetical protein